MGGTVGSFRRLWIVMAALTMSQAAAHGEIVEPDQTTDAGLKYATTWYGATWPGGPKWVQTHISYLTTLPDGRILTASPWDEAHREQTIYSPDGAIIAGVSTAQSRVVGGDADYVYARVDFEVDGERVTGIERFHLEQFRERAWRQSRVPYTKTWTQAAPFEGGRGDQSNRLPLAGDADRVDHADGDGWRPGQQLRGIASDGTTLFLSEDLTHHVHVIDIETMEVTRRFAVPYPGPLALDADGHVWVIHRPERSEGGTENAQERGRYRIVQYTAEGEPTGRELTDMTIPTAIAIGGPDHLLYVADIGPERMNVQMYDISGDTPEPVGELGEPGGVYTGPVPGRMGTHRFDFLSGVGVDDEGHVAIATRGRAGSFIRRFSPDGSEMLWNRYTAQFMNGSSFDPAYDGTIVFGGHGGINRFILDYARDDRLDDWAAITSDPIRFPHDRRGFRGDAIRFPNDKLYMVTDVHTHGTLILREEEDSEIFIPSVFLSSGHGARDDGYPPQRPRDNGNFARMMWRDLAGDGQMRPEEYVYVESHQNMTYWFVDEAGAIWEYRGGFKGERPHGTRGFLRFPLKGFDEHDNPVWDFSVREGEGADLFEPPPPFAEHERHDGALVIQDFFYDAPQDRMFIAGYPDDYEGVRGGIGPVIVRYDHFTDLDRREKVSRMVLPFDQEDAYLHAIRSFHVLGDLLVAGIGRTTDDGQIWVYNTVTGESLGAMRTGDRLFGEQSWLDIPFAVNGFVRENGEVIVTVENNWKNLQIVYRIPPQQRLPDLGPSGWEQMKAAPADVIDPQLEGR